MSYIGNPRKGFNVMSYNQQKFDREKKAKGNLYHDYPVEFLERVWDGCATRDCLPKCNTLNGHCERLKIAFDDWSKL